MNQNKTRPKKSRVKKETTTHLGQFHIEEVHLKKGEIIEITPDMIIGDVALAYPETLKIFEKAGIHCVGCYASTFESIEEGLLRHGQNPEKFCKEINTIIRAQHPKK